MAYADGKNLPFRGLTTAGVPNLNTSATTAARQFRWMFPTDVIVRGWGIQSLVTKAGAARLSLRHATGGAASVSGNEISRITLANTNNRYELYMRKGLHTTVSVGSSINAIVTTAATGVVVVAHLYVESKPYDYGNKTQVTTVTT